MNDKMLTDKEIDAWFEEQVELPAVNDTPPETQAEYQQYLTEQKENE